MFDQEDLHGLASLVRELCNAVDEISNNVTKCAELLKVVQGVRDIVYLDCPKLPEVLLPQKSKKTQKLAQHLPAQYLHSQKP